MRLERVTITGADNSVAANQLLALSQEFPFVEWGILFSPRRQGSLRFPSASWVNYAVPAMAASGARLSAHLCGAYVRDLVKRAEFSWRAAHKPDVTAAFQRAQLNFHGEDQDQVHAGLAAALTVPGLTVIGQCDGVNDLAVRSLRLAGVDIEPLFDVSHGAGVVPEGGWPSAWPGVRCGYAGGLCAGNVLHQLAAIDAAAPGDVPVWIDMERRVRTADDTALDLGKVRAVLAAVAPQVAL